MKCMIVFVACLAMAAAQARFGQQRSAFGSNLFAARPQVYRPAASTVTVTRAAPSPRVSSSDQNANIVRYENDVQPDGAYKYSYETDNGIAAQEQGTPRDFGGNPKVVADVAQGSYAFTSPEGQQVSITYTADENGFQPQGDVIPTAPPTPPQILRALEWIARNPQRK